jgi:hypothetical protein
MNDRLNELILELGALCAKNPSGIEQLQETLAKLQEIES